MSFASRFNKGNRWDIDTTGFEFFDLEYLIKANGKNYVYMVRGAYINTKGKYDPAPVIISDDKYINAPSHMCAQFNDILADEQAIEDIKNGRVGVKIYKYYSQNHNRDCYSLEFVDIK